MGFFDSLWQALPGTDILYHLTKHPRGISAYDYAGFACTATECRTIPAIAIVRCRRETAVQAATWIAEWVGISTSADIIKVIAGVIIGAAFGSTGVGLGIGVALAVVGVVDIAIVQNKVNKIAAASVTAMGIYCICGWEGPAQPSGGESG